MDDDAWEKIRFMTIDELITRTKLAGSALGLHGFTTPEGYPFALVVAVGSPGNEKAVEWVNDIQFKLKLRAGWTARADRPRCSAFVAGGQCAGLEGHPGDHYANARDRKVTP